VVVRNLAAFLLPGQVLREWLAHWFAAAGWLLGRRLQKRCRWMPVLLIQGQRILGQLGAQGLGRRPNCWRRNLATSNFS
jgi:hypothetical protein